MTVERYTSNETSKIKTNLKEKTPFYYYVNDLIFR